MRKVHFLSLRGHFVTLAEPMYLVRVIRAISLTLIHAMN